MPDPMTIATRYGLPWGIATGLAVAVAYLYKTTTPNRIYDRECDRNESLTKAVASLVADVQTLLALAQRGRSS